MPRIVEHALQMNREPTRPKAEAPAARSYFLVFEGDSTTIAELPVTGKMRVGRSDTADIRLRDPSVFPDHARVLIVKGEVTLEPNEGACLVNGVPIEAPRPLTSGDVVALGNVTLGFRGLASRAAGILEPQELARRIDDEVQRFLRTQRPFALVVLDTGHLELSDATLLADAIARKVRGMDAVSWDGQREFVILLPETSDLAAVPAERLLRSAVRHAPQVRAGLARCPEDGCDRDALITGARNAARAASPATVAEVSAAVSTLRVGDQEIVAVDPIMGRLFALVHQVAASDMSVLITGETGTGKEIIATAIHEWSPRHGRRLVALNCAALPETLLESELFGYERGAFSGAVSAKPGLIESAEGGTLFLDEIGECSPKAQAGLLRVLEVKRVSRLGSVHERAVDIRIVAATNRSLDNEVEAGRFRADLYFRLCGATLVVPPLRDRPLDLPVLARTFLQAACVRLARGPLPLAPSTLQRLSTHPWPGNVRELKNLVDYLAATVTDTLLEPYHLPERFASGAETLRLPAGARGSTQPPGPAPQTLRPQPHAAGNFRNIYEEIAELERTRIQEALAETNGVRVRAAELIGMPLRTLVTKMRTYGLASTPSIRGRR
ncbi:MAG: sigma 54-interacting transcriptional regulator [Myxococcales bacterium]